MVLRNRLKVYRAMLNVNQQELGRLCGVTLALTIAKVCGAAVEEIFYLQEEAEHEE